MVMGFYKASGFIQQHNAFYHTAKSSEKVHGVGLAYKLLGSDLAIVICAGQTVPIHKALLSNL